MAGAPDKATKSGLAIEWPAVGYVVLGFTYVLGGALLGIGLYMVIQGVFPRWWKEWILRPVIRTTPGVARLQGVSAVGLGLSLVAIGLSGLVSRFVGGLLVVLAIVAYVAGAGIFAFSTWLSRRRVAG